jgi:hypothetical protein
VEADDLTRSCHFGKFAKVTPVPDRRDQVTS